MEQLQSQWNVLYRERLPALAKQKDKAQQKWPVALDHCFARIILDNAVGKDRPWTEVVKAPATRNMSEEQIRAALGLGERICTGEADLQQLDQQSLLLRGKTKGGGSGGSGTKRKSFDDAATEEASQPKKSKMSEMADIWEKYSAKREGASSKSRDGLPTPDGSDEADLDKKVPKPARQTAKDDDDEALEGARRRIQADGSLSAYRKQVLTLLTQVPRSRFTTYKELSNGCVKIFGGTSSNARAIGGAMRNNPFAPVVPCHRVLASDGKLGGYKGDWGEEGRFAKEKRRLLREEGVKFDGKGRVVGQPFTGFFRPK